MKYVQELITKGRTASKHVKLRLEQNSSDVIQKALAKKDKVQKFISVPVTTRIENSVKFIDETLGVAQVMQAQDYVSQQEQNFLSKRNQVQQVKSSLDEQQNLLSETRKKLDRCDRADERYLTYVGDEHKLLLEVKKLQQLYNNTEEMERQKFLVYSSAVRLSHEKERSRAERTKYWSIIGSVTGTALGFMFSSLLTQYRLSSMREMTKIAISEATSDVSENIDQQGKIFLENIAAIQTRLNQYGTESSLSGSFNEDTLQSFVKELGSVRQYFDSVLKTISNMGEKVEMVETLDSRFVAMDRSFTNITERLKIGEVQNQRALEILSSDLQRIIKNVKDEDSASLNTLNDVTEDVKSKADIISSNNDSSNILGSINSSGVEIDNLTRSQNIQTVNLILTVVTLGCVIFQMFSRPIS